MNLASYIVVFVVLCLVALAVWGMRKSRRSCCGDKKTGGDCASCPLDCPFRR